MPQARSARSQCPVTGQIPETEEKYKPFVVAWGEQGDLAHVGDHVIHPDVGKAFLYAATTERARTFGPLLSRLVRRAFQGNSAALVASLFESRPPDAHEIAELDALLEDWRAREGKARPK